MKRPDIDKQLEVIKRGAVEIISEDELKKKLTESIHLRKPLKIKAGFDPTVPDLHLGHTVLLKKLRQFQDLGHQIIFVIGDFTAQIGDPSGQSEMRKQLTKKEVLKNAATYKQQVSKILDVDRLQIVFNSTWFEKMSVLEILKLTTHTTVSQMLARADFKKRLSKNEDISLLEFMYPLLQGYDSVVTEADVELGGTDQLFNLLVGRDIQKDFRQPQQVIMTLPLLEGTDGVQKMSKTFGNYIGINEAPDEMFGKIMSISDELMLKYYELLTDRDLATIKKMHPREAKLNLAEGIVSDYHGANLAKKARENFIRIFSQREAPRELPIYKIKEKKSSLIDILVDSGLVKTKNEARRLIQQGAVTLDEVRLNKEDTIVKKAGILKIGKRRFLRLEK